MRAKKPLFLIYSPFNSPRLEYLCTYVFEKRASGSYSIFTDWETFEAAEGFKIVYGLETSLHFCIYADAFLNKKNPVDIWESEKKIEEINQKEIFFTKNKNFSFQEDIFSAIFLFFCQLWPLKKEQKQILFQKLDIQNTPWIENILTRFFQKLNFFYPSFILSDNLTSNRVHFIFDRPYKYKHMDLEVILPVFLYQLYQFHWREALEMMQVLFGIKRDPHLFFYTDFLKFCEQEHTTPYFYFNFWQGTDFLTTHSIQHVAFQKCVKNLYDNYPVGLSISISQLRKREYFDRTLDFYEITTRRKPKRLTFNNQPSMAFFIENLHFFEGKQITGVHFLCKEGFLFGTPKNIPLYDIHKEKFLNAEMEPQVFSIPEKINGEDFQKFNLFHFFSNPKESLNLLVKVDKWPQDLIFREIKKIIKSPKMLV